MKHLSCSLFLLFAVACSNSPGRACTPGSTSACVCSDGRGGAQACAADGSGFGLCTCGGNDAGIMVIDAGMPCGAGCSALCPCPTGQTCSAGSCVACMPHCDGTTCGDNGCGSPCTCASGTVCDPTTHLCVTACPTARQCGTACCATSEDCVSGACHPRCASSTDCAPASPCCALIGSSTMTVVDHGVCLPVSSTVQCRCRTVADCPTGTPANGACAPAVDVNGVTPLAADVCVPNDCQAWHGCSSATCLPAGTCFVHDSAGNGFCATTCSLGTTCTPGPSGAARCSSAYMIGWASGCSASQMTCSPT